MCVVVCWFIGGCEVFEKEFVEYGVDSEVVFCVVVDKVVC